MMKTKKLLAFIFSCCICSVYASDYVMRTNDGVEHSLDDFFSENNKPYFEQLVQKHDVSGYRDLVLETQRGARVRARLYERGHQTLIVLSLGKGADLTECEHYAEYLIGDYDVLIFEYAWAPLNQWNLVRHTVNGYFMHNHEEVIAASRLARALQQRNGYRQIVGMGECYSAFTCSKAQALRELDGEKLFDKLILDSCLVSLGDYVRSFIVDPVLMYDSLKGGFPNFLKPCTKLLCAAFNRPINCLYRDAQGPIEVTRYLPHITVPILFIRGANDPSISWENFENAWNSARAPKAAFITPFQHANNFQYAGRPFYLSVVQHFIDDNLL
ncbi:MAG: hypothetical protein WCW33_05560 [Candidatus Babeliales bacterium]